MYPQRTIKKLNIDSDQQQRQKKEKINRKINIISAKQQFKRRQTTDDSASVDKNVIQQNKKREENMDMSYLFKADSDQDYSFVEVEDKIVRYYPQFLRPLVADGKRQAAFTTNINQHKRKKSIKNEDQVQSNVIKEKRVRKDPLVKNEQSDLEKQKILREFAVRWWYSYPQWPPKNFNYEKELLNQGYRIVQENRFKFEQNIVDGLLKAAPVKGFPGFFKTKNKLLDLRQKESAPSIQTFRQKSTQQLLTLLKLALKNQIKALSQRKYRTEDEDNLLSQLKRKYKQYSLF